MQFKHMLLGLTVLCFTATKAQQMPTVPVDKQVRIGHLENGLTYYIRANKLPENRANFYIVQRVGSILEEENQRGLAHFLEHMAFPRFQTLSRGSNGQRNHLLSRNNRCEIWEKP